MKILLKIILLFLFFYKDRQQIKEIFEIQNRPIIDTIIEYNSPDLLDLNRHQLFIDTTRKSKFFEEIIYWRPNENAEKTLSYYFKEISKTFELKKIDLKDFPRNWVSIHQLNNEYVAYNPINGVDFRFFISDSSVNYYRIEPDADIISNVVLLNSNELILELRTIPHQKQELTYLKVTKIDIPYLYHLQFSDSLYFKETEYLNLITPVEHLDKFNLVVSSAPFLVNSIVKFDKVKRAKR